MWLNNNFLFIFLGGIKMCAKADEQKIFIQSDGYRGLTDSIDEINHISPTGAKILKNVKRIIVNNPHDDKAMIAEVQKYIRDFKDLNPLVV
jgi:hypothetical protein